MLLKDIQSNTNSVRNVNGIMASTQKSLFCKLLKNCLKTIKFQTKPIEQQKVENYQKVTATYLFLTFFPDTCTVILTDTSWVNIIKLNNV